MAPARNDAAVSHHDPSYWERTLGPAFSFLATDPGAGASIVGRDMTVLFCNEQAVRIFSDKPLTPEHVVGRSLTGMCPAVWVDERAAAIERVLNTRRPMLLRTIWRGLQHVNWMQAIDPSIMPDGAVFVITRRVQGDLAGSAVINDDSDVVYSNVMTLGPLEHLSNRELEILALIGQGLSIRAIASFLVRSEKTVEHHRLSIGRKLNASDRARLIEIAREAGLTIADARRLRL